MQYILEVENTSKKINSLKEAIIKKELRFNISDYEGKFYFFGLGNCSNKKYYSFSVPDNVTNVYSYLQNNIDILELRPTFIEKVNFIYLMMFIKLMILFYQVAMKTRLVFTFEILAITN